MKSYTDLEQSKKLEKILPLESADLYYDICFDKDYHIKIPTNGYFGNKRFLSNFQKQVPCWSLATLFSMLPKSAYLEKGSSTELCRVTLPVELISSDWNLEPVDACVEMIIKLNEQKLL